MFKVNLSIPVDEGNDDVLDIDMLMEVSAGTQERVQGLKVELVWENLFKTRCLVQESRTVLRLYISYLSTIIKTQNPNK